MRLPVNRTAHLWSTQTYCPEDAPEEVCMVFFGFTNFLRGTKEFKRMGETELVNAIKTGIGLFFLFRYTLTFSLLSKEGEKTDHDRRPEMALVLLDITDEEKGRYNWRLFRYDPTYSGEYVDSFKYLEKIYF